MKQPATVKRQRVITGVEQPRAAAPEAIPHFSATQRLLPGSITKGVFHEAPGEARRIPFSNAQIQIISGQSPAFAVSSEFLLGRPQISGFSADSMNGDRLSILNLTKHKHRITAKDGVHFGGVGAPLVMSLSSAVLPSGGIFRDGEKDGSALSIGPFGSAELYAYNGRWQIVGGRNLELNK